MHTEIVQRNDDILEARGRLSAIRDHITELLERRRSLMITTAAELAAAGIEAHVVSTKSRLSRTRLGDHVGYVEQYMRTPTRLRVSRGLGAIHVGLRGDDFCLTRWFGTFEVLLIDDDLALIAKVPDVDDEERAHRLAVGRLRGLARGEDLRVRVRDRAISLVDREETVVFSGEVFAAFAWILNYDLDDAKPYDS